MTGHEYIESVPKITTFFRFSKLTAGDLEQQFHRTIMHFLKTEAMYCIVIHTFETVFMQFKKQQLDLLMHLKK
jgi:hypothetical protein